MNKLNQQSFTIGVLFLRLLLGVILIMQGYGKIFTYGIENVYQQFFLPYAESTFLSEPILIFAAYFTSYVEFIGGILLIIGFARIIAYILIALVILIVSYGHGLMQPIWDLHHVFVRGAFLFALFIIPLAKDKLSLDFLIKRLNKN